MAFQSLASNKVRAALTMLGIIIGVGSVITMTAIGEGASQAVANQINAMGTNALLIFPGATNVSFYARAVGTAPLQYDWFFNGVKLENEPTRFKSTPTPPIPRCN